MSSEEQAVAAVLGAYEAAVNASDLEGVVGLFAGDGVVMAQGAPPGVGREAVRGAYAAIFGAVALDIRFEAAEVRLTGPDWAFLRSTSTGSITPRGGSGPVPEHNQELFVFQKLDGAWRIARYCFNVINA